MVIRGEGVEKTTAAAASMYGKPISYKLRRSASIEHNNIIYLPNNNIIVFLSFFLLPGMNNLRLRAGHNNGPVGRGGRRKERKKYVTKFIRVNRAKRFYAL